MAVVFTFVLCQALCSDKKGEFPVFPLKILIAYESLGRRLKNDVKNGYREHPGKENLEKWSKICIFPSRHTAKKMKNDHFPGPFLQQQG